ncbi:ATP-dependent zinc metalloprotease FtsH [Flavilitoribacter nigricans]|uniref:ATP-dependent zinc metalloprotease FtsH n=1 Tax=Flavilitoribacter nigricans (strain ATCC 23147 / DSM 23189 / NBRC 102662 / NCIMB 1420 / SS-2) TaxID=1122177 RepID=A0A2D0MYC7_FLAN2|nr:ATP-dependent zinc metalloprotease FtsH [Flavilitoribacter nigricans]PHN01227.1 peptidase M41 [Flavilitoribacter nigricans DSM 23189 = NBRC 102662]
MAEPKKSVPNDKKPSRSPFSWMWILLVFLLAGQAMVFFGSGETETISWTEFRRGMLAKGDVEKIVVINKEEAEVYLKPDKIGEGDYADIDKKNSGPHYSFNIGSLENFEQTIDEVQTDTPADERIDLQYEERTDYLGNILSWLIPLAIIIGIWIFIMGRVRPSGNMGGSNIFDFGKSKAQLFEKDQSKITFDDVAGLDEVKVEVREVVDFLKNPTRYTRLGAKIPKGVLLIGPPGTGKTLLAKAVAGEAGVPFYSISGSEFVEMFVGVGASRVRDLFKKAKQNAPSIIFIDEIDAIGRSRGKAASFQSNDERENTLNQMLTEMDGFGSNTGVIVMAATNRGEILDSALLRPGRFDRQIYLELPTKSERRAIFEVHTAPLKLAHDLNLDQLASQTPGFSGADIANICNEAALIAARRNKDAVEFADFMDATDRVIAGMEKKNKIISEGEKKTIAYHEAGHATASWYLKHADSLLKVSIVPRGRSLGAAWYLPEENVIYTKEQFVDRLCATLAGRASEEINFGKISSGALDDLEKVTKQAYTMVAYYGLSEKIGNLSFYDSTGQYESSFQKPYSEATAQLIDQEVKSLVEAAYERTKKILVEHQAELEELAELLLKKEVVYKDDLVGIFGERKFAESETASS